MCANLRSTRVAAIAAKLLLCPGGSTAWAKSGSAFRAPLGLPAQPQTIPGAWPIGSATIALSEVMLFLVCALVCGLLVAGFELVDAWRDRREGEAARLSARIVSALRRDRLVGGFPVTPVVRLPVWGRSQGVRVEMRGRVPTHWLRRAALRAAEREVAACAALYRIVDQIEIAPSTRAVAV